MKKRIKDLEDFALLDPTFFIALKGANTCFADFTYQTMGMGYYAHSAEKYVTNVTQELYEKAPTDAKTYLTNILTAKYGDNWKRLKEALLDSVYDPIENYLMNEKNIKDETTTTFGKKIDDDDTITFGKKVDDDNTLTKAGKEKTEHEITKDNVTLTPGVTTTVEGDVYGYNSSSAVPSDKRVESKRGEDTQEHELSESNELSFTNRTDSTERDYAESGTEGHEKDYQESGTEKVKHDYEFERRGNVGVTTSQQMLQSEIELRKWSFLESVYSDIDKVLTLQTY